MKIILNVVSYDFFIMISVIIPTLNEEKLIGFTLKCLRNQDFSGKYEVIVADSCSTDNTVRIARKYADKVVIDRKGGVSAGRNLGARAARGEILVFVDADVYVLPNFLSTINKHFRDKNLIGLQIALMATSYPHIKWHVLGGIFHRLSFKLNFPIASTGAFACRRKPFFEVGGFNEKLRLGEDVDLGMRLARYAKIHGKYLKYTSDTFVMASTRRLEKWGMIKVLTRWPLGYFIWRFFKKNLAYDPIR
ncbi:MAG: glycosyltransferase [Candidatus Nanoarchaeia archaeon]|nr:glycosyltransferase [Candidatus Haiyanarchaeum thermophilum]